MRTHVDTTLDSLVSQGTISAEQATQVQAALSNHDVAAEASRRHLIAEILSYVGGAVIVISGAFIVAQAWEPLGAWGRSGLIALGAVILFVGGWLLDVKRKDDSARRLAGALFTGSAVLSAIAVGSLIMSLWGLLDYTYSPETAWRQPAAMAIAAASGLLVAIIGYLRVHTILGQAAMAFGATATLMAVGTSTQYFQDQSDMAFPSYGFWLVLALGIAWIVMARAKVFAESTFALVVGAVLVLFGAQATRSYENLEWLSGSLFVFLGVVFLGLYLAWRAWPMLAAGIAAILIGGIELFVRYLEGIGAALGSLALGVVLLVIGLLLPRGVKRLEEEHSHDVMLSG